MTYQLVFYSPGPYCNTETFELTTWDSKPTEADLAEEGYQRAIEHFENYCDVQWDEDGGAITDDSGMEAEFEYCWYEVDDPYVQGKF